MYLWLTISQKKNEAGTCRESEARTQSLKWSSDLYSTEWATDFVSTERIWLANLILFCQNTKLSSLFMGAFGTGIKGVNDVPHPPQIRDIGQKNSKETSHKIKRIKSC